MLNHNSIEERINELKRIIFTLEWDIPHIQNNSLREKKEGELVSYKRELEALLVYCVKGMERELAKQGKEAEKAKELKRANKIAAMSAKTQQLM